MTAIKFGRFDICSVFQDTLWHSPKLIVFISSISRLLVGVGPRSTGGRDVRSAAAQCRGACCGGGRAAGGRSRASAWPVLLLLRLPVPPQPERTGSRSSGQEPPSRARGAATPPPRPRPHRRGSTSSDKQVPWWATQPAAGGHAGHPCSCHSVSGLAVRREPGFRTQLRSFLFTLLKPYKENALYYIGF